MKEKLTVHEQKYLVSWNTNWADEMDINGFSIMTQTEWNNYKKKAKGIKKSFDIYVGSNEEIDYENGSILLGELSAKKINDDEIKVLKKFIGEDYGFTDFLSALEDMDEEDEEDKE